MSPWNLLSLSDCRVFWPALPAEAWIKTVEEKRFPRFFLSLLELVAQHPGQPGVGDLRHPRDVQRRRPLLRIVVDIEVLGLDDPKVEAAVLHLVASEVGLRFGHGRQRGRQEDGGSEAVDHGTFLSEDRGRANAGASEHSRSSW